MKKLSITWLIAVIIIVVFGLWYYWSSIRQQSLNSKNTNVTSQSNTSSVVAFPAATTSAITVVLNTASTSKLGVYFVALNGMTLYKFTKDKLGVSNCTGQCAVIWPPYTVSVGEASSPLGGGSGLTGAVGTIRRSDGTFQVIYNDTPLYFYFKDKNVGDTTGQGIGGVWFVVNP